MINCSRLWNDILDGCIPGIITLHLDKDFQYTILTGEESLSLMILPLVKESSVFYDFITDEVNNRLGFPLSSIMKTVDFLKSTRELKLSNNYISKIEEIAQFIMNYNIPIFLIKGETIEKAKDMTRRII